MGTTFWFFRLKNFDTATFEGRSKERYRRVALTAIASGIGKGISVLTGLITIPLTLHYLGVERYGVWMTISSMVLLLGFADLGMGNGLLNAISEAHGNDDRQAALNYISSGFFLLSGVALLIVLIFIISYPFFPWERVFNVQTKMAAQEAGPAMGALVVIFALNLPLGVVQRVQMGYQEGYQTSLYQCLGSILGLIAVLLVIYLEGGLAWLVLAMAGGPTLAVLLNWVIMFKYQRPWLRPQWRNATSIFAKKIFHLGILFFVLQLSVALTFSSDNIIAAQVLGPEAVTQYSVPMRLFSIFPMIMGMFLAPLWPAYGEAITRGDYRWVKETLIRSLFMVLLIVGIPSILLIFFGVKLVHLWVGEKVTPSFLLILGLAIWNILGALGNAVAMLLNGANIIRFQIICTILLSISAIMSKIYLAKMIGLPGIIWGTIIPYFIFMALPCAFYIPRSLAKMELK